MDVSTAIQTTDADHRAGIDRRNFNWRTVAYGFILSRRHAHRRDEDQAVIFLDWHHPWLFFLAVGTMLLSCADAFFTLRLLELGMIEANPVMQALMDQGTATFVSSKLAMTASGIFVLVFLSKARFLNRLRTGLILTTFFSGYCVLVCYELVNLFRLL